MICPSEHRFLLLTRLQCTIPAGQPKHGIATYVWPNGNMYFGEWKNDLCWGRGVKMFRSGDRYDGEWKEGKKHGRGLLEYVNEARYEGEFCQGKKEGYGVLTFVNGDQYDGHWKGMSYIPLCRPVVTTLPTSSSRI